MEPPKREDYLKRRVWHLPMESLVNSRRLGSLFLRMGTLVIRKPLSTNSKGSIKSPYLDTHRGGM